MPVLFLSAGVSVLIEKRKRIVIPYRSVIKWIVRLRRSPRAIAGGLALGTFVAFTPTVGVQFAISIFLATLLGMNRPASLVGIWITNPATIAPVYTFNYWVGKFIWPGPPVGEVYRSFVDLAAKLLSLDVWDFFDQFRTVISLGREVIIPLMIGSCLVGIVAAVLVYVGSMLLLRYILILRSRRRVLR
jgi:uncharacterized protein (DUF2062 family)